MSKILVLGSSGSGKSTAIGNVPKLKIKGLDPTSTFIIACSSKGLPFGGWMNLYKKAKIRFENNAPKQISPEGNYYHTVNGHLIAKIITLVNTTRSDITTIVIDDLNYVMQDYYMEKGVKGGYDVFKQIGHFMGMIFNAIDAVDIREKNVIVNAHFEEFKAKNNDTISFRFKTVGKMVQDYVTPEGKFEIVLFTTQTYDQENKTVSKQFVTNYDGEFPSKSPVGMFDELYIPNDFGYVIERVNAYNTGAIEPVPVAEAE